MKSIKLSVCALAVLTCFQTLNAVGFDEPNKGTDASGSQTLEPTPLEEVIKDIDIQGLLRYRYYFFNGDGGREARYQNWGGSSTQGLNQIHAYRADIGFSGAISDDFKLFTHLGYSAAESSYGPYSVSSTTRSLAVRQLYVTYTNEDLATQILLGKQKLDTIWTLGSYYKEIYMFFVGQGVKVINNSIEGLTLNLFAFDSFSWNRSGLVSLGNGLFNDSESEIQADVGSWIVRKNFYAASALGSYEFTESNKLDSQFWLGLIPNRAVLYALDLSYKTTLFDDVDYTITGTYLGNSVGDIPKKQNFTNGNYVQLDGSLSVNNWDFNGGIVRYGDLHKKSFTVIEDSGMVNIPGIDVTYSNGSRISGDIGRNTFVYLGAGYTFFEKLRLSANVVYGGTKIGQHEPFYVYDGTKDSNGNYTPIELIGQAAKKSEFYVTASYTYSPKLTFSAWFTHIDINRKSVDGHKNIAQFQAMYKF